MKRSRVIYFLFCCALIVIALDTRQQPNHYPRFVVTYGGDTLWATMIFFAWGFMFRRWPTRRLVLFSLVFCYSGETSQHYHAPWIDAIRDTRLGGLILGYTFLWSDLLCYTIGVCLGGLLDVLLGRLTFKRA